MINSAAKTNGNLIRVLLSYWWSSASLQAWALTCALIICTGLIVLLTMQLNSWQVGFYTNLQQLSYPGFTTSLTQFIILSLVLVAASGSQTHFKMMLQIRWRQWITDKYISLWLHNQTYFRMSVHPDPVDNPDQRIGEDINLFVTHSLELATGFLRQIISLTVFAAVLWHLSGEITVSLAGTEFILPGYLVLAALIYSACGTWITVQAGHPLMRQSNVQQSNEADFRYCLIRLQEYGECVALYKGDQQEKVNLMQHLARIVATYLSIIKTTRTITWISSIYSQLSIVFAFLIASPRYFNGELLLGQLFEISGAYWYVHSALSYLIDSFGKIAQWQAVTDRLREFYTQLAASHRETKPRPAVFTSNKYKTVAMKNLTVLSPAGQILINNLTLELKPGESILITGPSGCGKTTLLKTLSGIWPFFAGKITLPPAEKMLFLPQKPYLPIGSLRKAILYPHSLTNVPNLTLKELLTICGLCSLQQHLDREADWSRLLSMGELQRLSIARAILHQPEWLFLDETTSCIDTRMEQAMYRTLKEKLPQTAFISIGHRGTLKAYHRWILHLEETGLWHCSDQLSAAGTGTWFANYS
ncbi:ABC transporter ATP-binding protein/permease [Sporomusa termitida]|uniref:Vitamin B12 transport ATP-binding protein BacA n=1 Tax=Sporomusa termitida TaxID=2377 RepID=A0A517DP21_9FIRM|nr:ABC transporter ATP-binding protein/permease [Sporomusa termitida]QDR79110.1 Vitamin B12 transport ATP-binding protein BacA [Sporomusa termitida]